MCDTCSKCKEGVIVPLPSVEKWCYKGHIFYIDKNILIPTCDICFAEYIDQETSDKIDKDLEKQYQAIHIQRHGKNKK